MVAEAQALAQAADERGVVLALNTQYAAAAEAYRQLVPEAPATPKRFAAEMTSKVKTPGPRGRDIWLDLMPHPLSILLALVPHARLVPGSVRATIDHTESNAEFDVAAGDHTCRVQVRLAKLPEPPFARHFGVDELVAEVGTSPDAEGVYHGFLRLGERERMCDDFMKTSIGRFCAAVRGECRPLVDAETAVRNLELLLTTLAEAEHGAASP